MIDPTIVVAALALAGVIFSALLKRKIDQDAEERKDKEQRDAKRLALEEARRAEEGRIIELMVKDFQSTREEVGGFTSRNKEMWQDIMTLQRANFDCESRCAALSRKVDALERDFTDWKALNLRWQTFTGVEAPP